jgi:hypothetical protein
MQESMIEYTNFRKRLDAVLRTRDVKQVQDFLIAEGQWSPGTPANAEYAMWKVALQCRPVYIYSLTAHIAD